MMVALFGPDTERHDILVGLTEENWKRIMTGEPVHISREKHGRSIPSNMTITIIGGKDEGELLRVLKRHGLVTDKTDVRIDPRLKLG